jgi:hypothetical protein
LKKLLSKHVHKNTSNLTKEEREKLLQDQKKSYLQTIVNKNLEEKYQKFQEADKE